MDRHEEMAARKWIMRRLRAGTPPDYLHRMVDQVAHGVLTNALEAERRERGRADLVTVERDELRAELAELREGIETLATGPARKEAP